MQNTNLTNDDKLILIGVIISAFGLNGKVLIKVLLENPADLSKFSLLTKDLKKIFISSVQLKNKNNIVCNVEGAKYRDEAEKLAKLKLYCHRSALPTLEEDNFYMDDLLGLDVLDNQGAVMGRISNIFDYGAGDILEITQSDNKKILYPFTKKLFTQITKSTLTFNG